MQSEEYAQPSNKVLTVCRLLGIDRVVAFALAEWLQDIKKNQLPSLLGGVGPLYSLVQLGQFNLVHFRVNRYFCSLFNLLILG